MLPVSRPRVAATILAVLLLPAQAAAERFEIDAAHSHVQFSVDRFGFNAIIGEFRDIHGAILLADDVLEGSSVHASVATASLASGNAERDDILKGEYWLAVERHPRIEFRSTRVERDGDRGVTIAGDLTFLGVTRPLVFEARLNRRGIDPSVQREAAGFTAIALLKRSEFGLVTGGSLIGDEVSIRIELIAHRSD